MKDNERKNAPVADAELDEVLAQMAEEVPPMPAGLHDRWMNAVRAEARQAAEKTEKTTHDRTRSTVRVTRILSTAAAFVFLIGGTLLYRNSKKTLDIPPAAEKREAAEASAEASAGEEASVPEMPAGAGEPETAYENDYAAEEPMMVSAYTEEADMAEEADSEADDGMTEYNAKGASEMMLNTYAAVPQKEEASVQAAGEAAETAGEAEEAAGAVLPAVAAPTDAPKPKEAAATEKEAASDEAATAGQAKETGFLQRTGMFFTDMGEFLLAALPYLLVLAVPAAVALIIRRRKAGRP